MKKEFFLIMFIGFMGGVLNAAYAEPKDEVMIQKVINGETVELSDGRRVKLIGVNTSQVHSVLETRFHLTAEKIAGLPLTRLSKSAVTYIENHAMGKNIVLSFDPANEKKNHKDGEGRTLAYIWYTTHSMAEQSGDGSEKIFGIKSDSRLLNQELITMGHGLVDTSQPFLQQASFLDSEKTAARDRRGFWRSAADVYNDLLTQARSTQYGAVSKFVSKDVQLSNMEASWKVYEDLIQLNPKDYNPYYERSWIGANSVHNKVSEWNFQDINQALELSPFNPKILMHKIYLLMLVGKYEDALALYEKLSALSSKFAIPQAVSDMVRERLQSPEWIPWTQKTETAAFAKQALRASLNEDHFLFFWTWYKSYEFAMPEDYKKIYAQISGDGRFQQFQKKYESQRPESVHRFIYMTQWSIRGHEMPTDVIQWMETIGSAPAVILEESGSSEPAAVTGGNESGEEVSESESESESSGDSVYQETAFR